MTTQTHKKKNCRLRFANGNFYIQIYILVIITMGRYQRSW